MWECGDDDEDDDNNNYLVLQRSTRVDIELVSRLQ
jgi:hypothetical protein